MDDEDERDFYEADSSRSNTAVIIILVGIGALIAVALLKWVL